ncbi:MAG: hypothetical protein CHACPFDD_02803 [Phycisphaerae bacterium]|nr:hypothetical protein [Phycisphaerae bacterium]
MLILAAWYHVILATIFATISVLLMLVILLQRGRGVGLSGAFGAAGGHSALGSKTGDILTWITMVGAGIFLLLAIGLNCVFRPSVTIAPPPPEVDRSGPLDSGLPPASPSTGGPAPAPSAGGPAPTPTPAPPPPASQPSPGGGSPNTAPLEEARAPLAAPTPPLAALIWPSDRSA